MATMHAIAAASQAVIELLRSGYRAEIFDGNELELGVYTTDDFAARGEEPGVSLFVYRVQAEGTYRMPAGRRGANGRRQRPQLPLELHFLLTAWAAEASMQHTIVAWMMRVLEDTPTLPASLLNGLWPDVFRPDESLEIVLGDLSTEELVLLWGAVTERRYHLSVPYVARVLRIESAVDEPMSLPVVERGFTVRAVDPEESVS